MEIDNVDFLKKNRKYAIPLIFIASAILTPPDVITQLMAAVPLIILYEIGIFFTRLTKKKKEEN
jgi:sec-independent protein translocase protein TatC